VFAMTVESHGSTRFTAPFAEATPAVLSLKRVGALRQTVNIVRFLGFWEF